MHSALYRGRFHGLEFRFLVQSSRINGQEFMHLARFDTDTEIMTASEPSREAKNERSLGS